MVNFIETKPIKSRLFKQSFTNMDSQHRWLLSHTGVRWLSRGKVLNRAHELQQELFAVFEEMKNHIFATFFNVNFGLECYNI